MVNRPKKNPNDVYKHIVWACGMFLLLLLLIIYSLTTLQHQLPPQTDRYLITTLSPSTAQKKAQMTCLYASFGL
jgi:hypothetical protein